MSDDIINMLRVGGLQKPASDRIIEHIEALRAENATLRAALRSLINAAEEITDDGMSHSERDWWFGELKAAFDALGDVR